MDKQEVSQLGKKVNVGLLGFGVVGSGVKQIIDQNQEKLHHQLGCELHISHILVRNKEKYDNTVDDRVVLTTNPDDILRNDSIDLVVEVIGGVEQAREYILKALQAGKHVITANKDLIALHGTELHKIAKENQCDLFYEASVGGGIPLLRPISEGLSADRIHKIMGIVNGTTNYILSKMSLEGAPYDDVLKEAMQLGYAEADPTSDVEGYDAAYKMAILGALGFRTDVSMDDVEVKGITHVSIDDILYGKRLGYEVKLLGIAERHDDTIHISVQPTMVSHTHPLASVNGVFNAVYVYGEAVGETMFYGPGAGEMPTATSVVADLVAVSKNLKLGVNGMRSVVRAGEHKIKSDQHVAYKNFLRLRVADKAGVLAQISQVFNEYDVSLETLLQQPNEENNEAEITIITHKANKANLQKVIDHIAGLDVVYNITSLYRVED